ncbi:MAG: outer membrane beta-barrel protein [Pedobacter sp.]
MLRVTRNIVSWVGALVVLLAFLPKPCSAALDLPPGVSKNQDAPVIKLGPVEVHPYLSLRETYSDNIYLTPDNKEHDFITSINPGLFLQLPFRRHVVSLGGSTTLNRYAINSSENTTDWSLYGAGDFYFGSRFNLKVSDNYTNSHEPRSQSSTSEIERYQNNTAATSLTYVLADISKVQLDYSRTYLKYRTYGFRSRNEDLVSAYLYYRILPRTSAFVEYEFKNVGFMDSTSTLDNNVHSGLLGVTWELSERSKGTIKGGYLVKNFDLQSQGSIDDFTASLDISHYFSDYNFMKLAGARTVNESSLQGTRYSVSTGINGEFTHRFLDRISSTIKASYIEERFSDIVPGDLQIRKDRVVQVGAALQYNFRRWLESSLEYYWRNKDSNIDIYDSTENNISLTIKVSF